MLRVVQARVVRPLVGAAFPERLAADGANLKTGQPARQPDGPENEIAERQSPACTTLDLAGGKQDQPEHRLVDLVFRKNPLGDFADKSETRVELVVALRLVERGQQFRLLDTDQVPRFPLEIPEPHMGQHFKCGAVAVFQAACASGYTAHAPRGTTDKTNQSIGLAQREGLQYDGFRFAGRHALSARRHFREAAEALRGNRAPLQNLITYHTQGRHGNDCVPHAVDKTARRSASRPSARLRRPFIPSGVLETRNAPLGLSTEESIA